ncbi:MAG TPA: PH domain-containing protein [Amycolatopsis sp.]|nr:PH domain-containing protein [Amycolatopsis sp.]
MAEETEGRKAIFKVPGIALLAVVFLMVCLLPTAFADVPGLWVLYVIPLGLMLFVVRTRTVASARGLAVRTVFGHRELPWEALKGLAITHRAKVRAVLTDDSQIPLPTVRTRHLPVISLVSEGRLKDPSGITDDMHGNSKADSKADTADDAEDSTAGNTEDGIENSTAQAPPTAEPTPEDH